MKQSSYEHGVSNTPLLGQTIGQALAQTVERFGEREALVVPHQGVRFTWREFHEQTALAARGLMTRGVKKGDRLGLWAPNRAEWVVLQYAAARVGAILVNLNPAYRSHELEYALKQSGVSLLVAAKRFRDADYVRTIREVQVKLGEHLPSLILDDDWKALLDDAGHTSDAALAQREASLQFDEPINLQYTSGTTGFPKGATLSHHNILNNGYFVARTLKYTEHDRVCIPVPLYHCFGMVMGSLAAMTHGACMVFPAEAFDAKATMHAVQAERCTSLYGVPTMFIAELEHHSFREFDFSSLRTGIMAGSPCPIEVMKRVQRDMHMPEVTICYGMTETSPVSTQSHVDDPLELRVSTVGFVHPHVEVKVIDPTTGLTMPRGTAGEVCTRGYSVMLGYWEDPASTRQAIDAGRWMHTGDLGVMNDDGTVNIVGRIKDMVLRGGENIYPREVEEFLYTLEGVADVQVIGVPDETYGEELMAWVKLKPGVTATGEELRAACKGKIARYKIPKYWKLVSEFPMTVTGKVQKFRMREQAIAELHLEKAAHIKTA